MSGLWLMFWFKSFRKIFQKNYDLLYFRSLVGNTVAVGGPTNKSGCLPSTGEHSLTGEGAGGGANCDISMQFYAAKNIYTIVPTL